MTFYWQEAELADQPAKWLRFVRWFRGRESPRGGGTASGLVELQRKMFGMRAAITRTIRQANGILISISRCAMHLEPVSGLTCDAFRVFFGSRKVEILQFWDSRERPSTGIDMSGSMSTEREAAWPLPTCEQF